MHERILQREWICCPHCVDNIAMAIITEIMKENTPDPSALLVVELSAAKQKKAFKYYFINLGHISGLPFMCLSAKFS